MLKRITIDRRAAMVCSLAAAALAGSAASVAGPGCMGEQQHMARGYYPGGPMLPQPAYRPECCGSLAVRQPLPTANPKKRPNSPKTDIR